MYEPVLDYGPSSFRMFHSWFKMEGFDKVVEDSWHSIVVKDTNGISRMQKKLKLLKAQIKAWINENKKKIHEARKYIQSKLTEVDKSIDQGGGNEEILNQRALLMKDLTEIHSIKASELSQKAKVHWSIEGDKNSKYFHRIINSKRSHLNIHGILLDGDWIVDHNKLKSEFLKHFSNQFSKPLSTGVKINFQFPTRLRLEQLEELERPISYEEIKKAVWDCGSNKSPGPDGKFPQGCNSSFIALISKIHDAKDVKDFWPVTLIGSLYNVIAKILANRLSLVISDLISDVQSAFISNRQILDGPFILNELISWCKHKKINAMIFKVDFQKAFDSIRWEYLVDDLKSFGFGDKWRGWIFGCLDSSMGSVLINGGPTTEFQFHKGLKQGDPLSPFLFILVMEILHISFARVLDAGLYKGKWDINNIKTIVNVLNCFFMASGLKINIYKSKLAGIGVSKDNIDLAANITGCLMFSPPFNYLELKLEPPCLDIIGERISLLKFLLVPAGILKEMESIRRNFFNGIDRSEKKMWMWRLITQGSSLWSNFIKAIHGDKGAIDNLNSSSRTSIWLDLIHEFSSLSHKGISVAEKMTHSSLNLSFRRLPRGGAEDVQYQDLCSYTSEVLRPNMWVKTVPIKVNILAWKINLDGLPTRLNLYSRGVEIPLILCAVCNEVVELKHPVF
ncbi:RNA-directed DNA polymerase, eukaryota [Tanacetum coccineum]